MLKMEESAQVVNATGDVFATNVKANNAAVGIASNTSPRTAVGT